MVAVPLALPFGQWASSAELTGAPSAAALDGRAFHGEILDEKGAVRAKDVLTFRDGRFHSVTCAQLGFGAAPYWTRVEGDTIHFLVETANSESGAMRFIGKVSGHQVDAQGIWTKQRWYWSIRREIRFRAAEKK